MIFPDSDSPRGRHDHTGIFDMSGRFISWNNGVLRALDVWQLQNSHAPPQKTAM
jgi:hypothetical protein